ncbi:MAG: cell division protein SepF [Acidimicrobiales bacterium]
MLKKALIYLAWTGRGIRAVRRGAARRRPSLRSTRRRGRWSERWPNPAPRPPSSTVRPIPNSTATSPSPGSSSVRVVSATPTPTSPKPDGASAIRIVESAPSKPHAVSPTSFNEAQAIGDRFKNGQPVIINLQGVERDLRRRLVDFASGLCYALGGKMDRVADQVYLLTPADVEVSSDDTRRALD